MSMAQAKTADSTSNLRRSISSGTLRKSGEVTIKSSSATAMAQDGEMQPPALPRYLDVKKLTQRRKLSQSTGNLHGYMAEDYGQVNWPLPKMFGNEKYAYSLIDIEDPRHVKECATMSKKLIRLSYDQQIVDLEWRKTYKALLDAEKRQATLPVNCKDTTKALLKKEVDGCMKYLLELQEQKDMYEDTVRDIWARCDAIKAELKKESDLEALREDMERQTRGRIRGESSFWRTKFNCRSQNPSRSAVGLDDF
mmetsp:Transcript_49946/g.149177  ORF Transcript_49946/g.149177 Transcript_49946/m.149177 type:complete len:252 (-) Transcript_49946:102-857(-)